MGSGFTGTERAPVGAAARRCGVLCGARMACGGLLRGPDDGEVEWLPMFMLLTLGKRGGGRGEELGSERWGLSGPRKEAIQIDNDSRFAWINEMMSGKLSMLAGT